MKQKIKKIGIKFIEKIRKDLFNKFYLDFIAYFIILIFGLILSAGIYMTDKNDVSIWKIILGIIITAVMLFMLYILGYLSARKKKIANKYNTCFGIYVVLFIIYIIATLFYKENSNNFFVIDFLEKIKQIILLIHGSIFNWLDILCNNKIPIEIYALITPFCIYLGSRKNKILKIKRIKKQKNMERREYNGE